MEKRILSKSTFIRGLQCKKSLYLYTYFYNQRDPVSPQQRALFSRGTGIGLFARKLFPGGVDVSPQSPSKFYESVIATKKEMDSGTAVIYEAAFQWGGVRVAVDMLVKKEGKWYAYEVKSSARVFPNHYSDASLQYFVITSSGISLGDFFLAHINNQYIKKKEIDPAGLFTMVSVKEEAEKNRETVISKITEFENMLAQRKLPDVEIGEHCFSPYDCDFMGTCWKNMPKHSVFEIAGLSRQEQFQLFYSGIKGISDIMDASSMKETSRIQVESVKKNEIFTDKAALKNFLSSLQYPLYFMDFETFMPAIPLFEGTHPYQHIPFQYSLHCRQEAGSQLTHADFLGEPHTDPRHDFIKKLLLDTVGRGSIIVYNAAFEKSVLGNLKNEFPELGGLIDDRISRIVDLMAPFMKKMYYHPAMKGSSSIKNVLPALVPDMNYDEMKISNGTAAMAAFENLLYETDIFKIAETRDALAAYCRLDTLAMVKILDELEKAIG